MNNKKNFNPPVDISSKVVDSTPETALEMITAYGTYNIQPTAASETKFPAIAQGIAKEECPDKEFHRKPTDPNPFREKGE